MSVRFVAVNWNRQKKVYDGMLALGVLLAVSVFMIVTFVVHPEATFETAAIRGLGLTALLLLHLILAVGPLARIDRRFLPLLYNRRHLGVTMAILAAGHATFAIFQYHVQGNEHPLVSVLVSNPGLPFELFGIVALTIILLMATTSHDFWLSVLTPPVWKRLHMLVYAAYVALVAHVALGALQAERHSLNVIAVVVGVVGLAALHLAAALRERAGDRDAADVPWVDVGPAADVPEGRAVVRTVAGERVAVFRHEGRLSCVSNVCKHQNGPLGEGRIIDGCITCPWHGYQYYPDSGTSPPPFHDTIPTFNLRLVDERGQVDARPNAPGTRVEPVPVPATAEPEADEFYVGYIPEAPPRTASFVRAIVVGTVVLAVGTAAALAGVQQTFDRAHFEFGSPRSFEGVIREAPYPMLEVDRPGGGATRYFLAAVGKHGAAPIVAGLDGRRVLLEGTLAYRSQLSLIELSTVTRTGDGRAGGPPETDDLGTFDLVGEIVDGKCYAGVMNPGDGPTHAGCAARCLAGGIPPLFVVEDGDDRTLELLVLGADGTPLPGVERLAGEPLAVRGRVSRLDDLYFLYADTASIRTLK